MGTTPKKFSPKPPQKGKPQPQQKFAGGEKKKDFAPQDQARRQGSRGEREVTSGQQGSFRQPKSRDQQGGAQRPRDERNFSAESRKQDSFKQSKSTDQQRGNQGARDVRNFPKERPAQARGESQGRPQQPRGGQDSFKAKKSDDQQRGNQRPRDGQNFSKERPAQARGESQGRPQQPRGGQDSFKGKKSHGREQIRDEGSFKKDRRPAPSQKAIERPPQFYGRSALLPEPELAPEKQVPSPPREVKVAATTHWREELVPLLGSSGYQPLDRTALAKRLHVPAAESEAFTAFLAEQEKTGAVMQVRHSLYVLPKRLGFCVGRLQMNERGFGFLVPSDPAEPDFYVAGEDTANAFHGDIVLARIKEQRGGRQRDSRLRGEVVKVLQRKRRQIVGTLNKSQMFFYVVPDETKIPWDVSVPAPEGVPPLGQKVVVELKDWPDRRKAPEGVITEVLGSPDAPGVDLTSIIRKHDLPTSFPEKVEQEAAEIPVLIPEAEIARREDFRKIFTLTIDPDDAKDFDDALSYRILPNGDFEIYIHIADVSHFVRPGTAMDTEARSRGNSVYLVDRVIPMLPEKLSNGICSLMPNVDRLVKTAIVTLDRKGETKSFRFAAGVIHSAKRFTYQEAFATLQKPAASELGEHVHALNNMAQILRKRRFDRGALDLEMPEIKVRVNELGIPTHLERMENDASHQLIEEFMLLANEVVALEIKRRGRPGIYRIHENPDPERLQEFRAQAKSMGFACGDLTVRGEIQKLLTRVQGQAGEAVVKIGLLKSLKRAMYSPKPLGHYGLSKQNYTHFTSPIRRYSDLVVHRVLFGDGRDADSSYDGLSRLALHLSTTERAAADAEQESVKLKKLEYFDLQSRETKRTSFPALIQEVRASGLMVQLPEFVIQGMVPMSGLEGDLFVFNPQRLELTGQRTRVTIRAGQTLDVEVARVDLGRSQVDFRATKQSLLKLSSSGRI